MRGRSWNDRIYTWKFAIHISVIVHYVVYTRVLRRVRMLNARDVTFAWRVLPVRDNGVSRNGF